MEVSKVKGAEKGSGVFAIFADDTTPTEYHPDKVVWEVVAKGLKPDAAAELMEKLHEQDAGIEEDCGC